MCVEDGKAALHAILWDDLLGSEPPRTMTSESNELVFYLQCCILGCLSPKLALPQLFHRLKFKVAYSLNTVLRNGLCLGECQSGKI